MLILHISLTLSLILLRHLAVYPLVFLFRKNIVILFLLVCNKNVKELVYNKKDENGNYIFHRFSLEII